MKDKHAQKDRYAPTHAFWLASSLYLDRQSTHPRSQYPPRLPPLAFHVDSWRFKAVANVTAEPAAPADIEATGVQVSLVTTDDTVLDVVAFDGSDCKGKGHGASHNMLRRIDCRSKSVPGKLSLVYNTKTSAIYTVSGVFSKRPLSGVTAANEVPLGVVLTVGADASGRAFGGM